MAREEHKILPGSLSMGVELQNKEELSQILASASIETFPETFTLTSISKKKLGMLLELVRVLEQGMFAFIIGEDQLTLVLNDRTWRKLEFDFDEGNTVGGLRLIAINSGIKFTTKGLTHLLAQTLDEHVGSIVAAFDSQYLLVHEKDLEDVLRVFKEMN